MLAEASKAWSEQISCRCKRACRGLCKCTKANLPRTALCSGARNDSFLSNPLKRNFRLSGVPLKLYRFISGRAIIFLSVRSSVGEFESF